MTTWSGAYIPGQPYGECDRCGFQRRLLELKTEWTNLKVCYGCYDPRPVHLSTPYLTPGEGAPLPGARPTIVYLADDELQWSNGENMLWSVVPPAWVDPVQWSND